MSAILVSPLHINTLVSFAARWDVRINYMHSGVLRAADEPARVAAILFAANVESLNVLYKQDVSTRGFKFVMVAENPLHDAIVIIKFCHSFDYQACEVKDYWATCAAAITRAIVDRATRMLPGYATAPMTI